MPPPRPTDIAFPFSACIRRLRSNLDSVRPGCGCCLARRALRRAESARAPRAVGCNYILAVLFAWCGNYLPPGIKCRIPRALPTRRDCSRCAGSSLHPLPRWSVRCVLGPSCSVRVRCSVRVLRKGGGHAPLARPRCEDPARSPQASPQCHALGTVRTVHSRGCENGQPLLRRALRRAPWLTFAHLR